MAFSDPQLPQWSALGEALSGPQGDAKREEILSTLGQLERQVETELRDPNAPEPDRLQALLAAVGHAKNIANKVLKPVDLSSL